MPILVDDQDKHFLEGHAWWLSRNGYVMVRFKGRLWYLHRAIMEPADGEDVDHVSGDRLDNRRANLRLATRPENMANSGPRRGDWKGVCWHKAAKKWMAQLTSDGVNYYLGLFEDPNDAAEAYNKKALEVWGEFAYQNEV